MQGVMLEAAGIASGVAAYGVGRWVLAVRDTYRDSVRHERHEMLDGLLAPYESVGVGVIDLRTDDADHDAPLVVVSAVAKAEPLDRTLRSV